MNKSKKSQDIHIIASEKNWIESEAIEQLKRTVKLPGMCKAIGMPDIQPGLGNPVGAVFICKGMIYPYIAGNDAGCGMGLWQTQLKRNKMKRDRWEKKLSGFENPWEGDTKEWLSQNFVKSDNWNWDFGDSALGTIGGGNHFAELQVFENIENQQEFEALKLDKNKLMLLVHSGSRGLGESLLRSHTDKYKAGGLKENSQQAAEYIKKHDHAVKWAKSNRSLIAHRFLSSLGTEGNPVLDLCHNSITQKIINGSKYWLHRKGAAPSDEGAIIIPGSRGSFTYLVIPVGNQESNGYSSAHGAGRKWKRSDSKNRLSSRYTPESLMQTKLGSKVICEDKQLLYEEAPQVYKNIEIVVKDLQTAGLITVIATLRPVITYKTRRR